MGKKCDFGGYATKANLRCADGLIIAKDAFKNNDGMTVPLVWNHDHNDPSNVLGHALLENRADGVYAYCTLNDTEAGQTAKSLIENGDVSALSIYANHLTKQGNNVVHGAIREVSLVLAGCNPGALIDTVISHSDGEGEEAIIYTGEGLMHGDDIPSPKEERAQEPKKKDSEESETIGDILNTLNEKQQTAVYALIGELAGEKESENNDPEEGGEEMKHNVFDSEDQVQGNVLSHSDEVAIINLAKQAGVGTLKGAFEIFAEENKDTLAHGFESYEALFPEYELLDKGEPYTLDRDKTWVDAVIAKIHKSPISRIRTRHADARIAELKGLGYQKKGNYKKNTADIKLLSRTTDPQTVYIKDSMHRDDIVDITDFDVVNYQWKLLRSTLDETLALAALVGDGRDDGDPDKIHEDHIRSIWHDDELYTIHKDVDIEAAKTKLQGTNTAANFSDNYVYAEAVIESSLYAREQYKGSGTPDLYITPHLLNVMLLARDLNGRRIYDSKSDLAAALNVGDIHTVEQFEGLVRTDEETNKHKLLGLFVNLADYQFGSTKGGEISKFEDFDINFNSHTYMLETRLSGSLTRPYAAIALEELVA